MSQSHATKSETPTVAPVEVSSEKPLTKQVSPMSNSITPAKFDFQGNNVRIVMRDGEPWFVASDVCAALEYSNPSKAVADHLDDDEKMTLTTGYGHSGKAGGQRLQIVINESGLYALVLRSRKPEARKFAKWVTNEVLPSIRKTGSYSEPSQPVDPLARLSRERFTLTIDADGSVRLKLMPENALCISPTALAHELNVGGISMTTQELATLGAACMNKLAGRAEYMEAKLTKPRLEPELRQRIA